MAFNDLTPLGMAQLGVANQAAAIFNPDAPHPVRQKHLFVVTFKRPSGTSGASWKNGLSFVIKSMERPQVQPQVEELNQYNKKRVIHTGLKYSPISCSFYDTADGAAMNMWIDYARYYFGDYNQDKGNYQDDIINNEMLDSTVGKKGYGFGIRPTSSTDLSGAGSQNFFSGIVVYQVWGNEYTSYELVNPRINSFAPDDLSYDASEASSITMSFNFEAIAHGNTGRPSDLFSETTLTEMFNGTFGGKRLEVLGPPKVNSFTSIAPLDETATSNGQGQAGAITTGSTDDEVARTTTSSEGGVLNRFGTYDFGTLDRSLSAPQLAGASQAFGGSSTLTSLLGGSFSGAVIQPLGAPTASSTAALGAASQYVDGLAGGLRAAAALTGESAGDLVSRDNGLLLSNAALRGVNQISKGSMQIGNKSID